MATEENDETGGRNDESTGVDYLRTLQLLRSKRELPCDTELLEVSEVLHLPNAEPP